VDWVLRRVLSWVRKSLLLSRDWVILVRCVVFLVLEELYNGAASLVGCVLRVGQKCEVDVRIYNLMIGHFVPKNKIKSAAKKSQKTVEIYA